jgi:hypothetical protein
VRERESARARVPLSLFGAHLEFVYVCVLVWGGRDACLRAWGYGWVSRRVHSTDMYPPPHIYLPLTCILFLACQGEYTPPTSGSLYGAMYETISSSQLDTFVQRAQVWVSFASKLGLFRLSTRAFLPLHYVSFDLLFLLG